MSQLNDILRQQRTLLREEHNRLQELLVERKEGPTDAEIRKQEAEVNVRILQLTNHIKQEMKEIDAMQANLAPID